MNNDNEELCEYELLALKNKEENRKKLLEIFGDLELPSEAKENVVVRKKRVVKKRKKSPTPLQRRKSERLKKDYSNPYRYVSSDVMRVILGGNEDNDNSFPEVNRDSDYDYDEYDSEEEEKRAKRRKSSTHTTERPILSVDDVTSRHIKNIAVHVKEKVYSSDGSTCHQCRQKTLDQKTVCRSSKCFGVRGQFCGPCLKNRYGEDVAIALKDPEWQCPPCRDQCNCSICRTQRGKIPTGQLTNLALQQGYNSVKAFLEENDED